MLRSEGSKKGDVAGGVAEGEGRGVRALSTWLRLQNRVGPPVVCTVESLFPSVGQPETPSIQPLPLRAP